MPHNAAPSLRTVYKPRNNFPGMRMLANCENCWSPPRKENRSAKEQRNQFEFVVRSDNTAFFVASSVNIKDSLGTAVTNGPIIQPSPAGISRERETTSLCRYTPLSFSSMRHQVSMPHKKPLSSW